ncbi:MAG: (4Fe-4S)-binding protein [Saprospiraceae bacterium]
MIKKEYTNGEITVIWQPGLCIHSGVCFHSLPAVFKPRERPWIQMDKSDTLRIEATVNACPSGALSLKIQPDTQVEAPATEVSNVKIIHNGPVRFSGSCLVTLQDGSVVEKPNGVSICRCGGSSTYPFCDGSHRTNGFTG